MHTGRAYVWGQWVTDSVRLHDLQLGHVETVAGLYGKTISVSEHSPKQDILHLVKTKASGDIALLSPLIKVIVIGFTSLGRRCVGLMFNTVPHCIKCQVV